MRGYDYREDLRALRPYIREYRPVLIGVDGGADALLRGRAHARPVVGDMDSVSDEVLRCGAEVVVHAYADGRAPGLARVQDLGVPAVVFPAAGTSEDMAMLLADEGGAQLIVAVGTHATLVEFLDKGRQGMASTFLTRLRVGSKLVDAKGVSRLYRSRISLWSLLALVLATLLAMAAALYVSPVGDAYSELLADAWALRLVLGRVAAVTAALVIDFRYHLVSIIAVFLALAVGIVVGTAALNGPIQTNLNNNLNRVTDEKRGLEGDVSELRGAARRRRRVRAGGRPAAGRAARSTTSGCCS